METSNLKRTLKPLIKILSKLEYFVQNLEIIIPKHSDTAKIEIQSKFNYNKGIVNKYISKNITLTDELISVPWKFI